MGPRGGADRAALHAPGRLRHHDQHAITRDDAAIDTGLAGEPLDELRAVVSGHAHYDHFIDVPHILAIAPNARAYTNQTGRHILAALAPDRPGCTTAAAQPTIDRTRVIAMDDALASHTDYTNCPAQRPDGAPLEGTWLEVSPHIRLKAFCSMHPAQVGPYHFGAGSIDQDQCDLPAAASGWLEGQTLAFLIDFLDDHGNPAYRVFYQDAPTNAPSGHIPDATLAEKPVDVAILCVGTADAVADHPASILGEPPAALRAVGPLGRFLPAGRLDRAHPAARCQRLRSARPGGAARHGRRPHRRRCRPPAATCWSSLIPGLSSRQALCWVGERVTTTR